LGDLQGLATLDSAHVHHAMLQPSSLHPQTNVITQYIVASATVLVESYGGDARNIWSPSVSLTELQRRLMAFHGIGKHKAVVGAFLLTVHGNVRVLDDGTGTSIRSTCPALYEVFKPIEAPILRKVRRQLKSKIA
jgi:hypothetical protein